MNLKILLSVLAAITKIPGLLRWIGKLFKRGMDQKISEVKQASEELRGAKDEASQDSALKRLRDIVLRNLR